MSHDILAELKTLWKRKQYGSLISITPCLLHYVCHPMFAIQCLSHNVCHTVFVTQCFSHNVSHTLSHSVGYPTLDYSVCHTLFNTDCMTNMTNITNITKRSHLFSVFCSLSFCFNLLLLSFCLVFVLTALFRMHRACSIAGCFQNPKGKLAKISWLMTFKAKIPSLLRDCFTCSLLQEFQVWSTPIIYSYLGSSLLTDTCTCKIIESIKFHHLKWPRVCKYTEH